MRQLGRHWIYIQHYVENNLILWKKKIFIKIWVQNQLRDVQMGDRDKMRKFWGYQWIIKLYKKGFQMNNIIANNVYIFYTKAERCLCLPCIIVVQWIVLQMDALRSILNKRIKPLVSSFFPFSIASLLWSLVICWLKFSSTSGVALINYQK